MDDLGKSRIQKSTIQKLVTQSRPQYFFPISFKSLPTPQPPLLLRRDRFRERLNPLNSSSSVKPELRQPHLLGSVKTKIKRHKLDI